MDNPHTKPVRFWQRLAADLQATHPEVVMLAEAFTKPAMMRGLAKAGFHLSYTYFTWRNGKQEITEYLEELAYETAHVLRPAFFPMTPDILTEYMTAGPAAFKARAVLAALSAPTWGILGGSYEFCENVPRPGVEEAIDNPKYEIKLYNWEARDQYGIASLNRVLNGIRRAHPALLQLRNIKFHGCDNENILVFSKHLDARHSPTGRDDTVLVVLNLDPHHTQEGWIYLDLPSLGLAPHEFGAAWRAENRGQKVFRVTDELSRGLTAPMRPRCRVARANLAVYLHLGLGQLRVPKSSEMPRPRFFFFNFALNRRDLCHTINMAKIPVSSDLLNQVAYANYYLPHSILGPHSDGSDVTVPLCDTWRIASRL
ncbi:Alpha-1,4-glucan:maltose-1-phosphate maltosyltransferase 2 [Mobiluncus mulieris]|nr:Alpha-1,4-glucan:maltose-1-phosphate maltosyltransferase 2 [Mobiluncus mulieris]